MNIFVFVVILIISYFIVRVGAVAFELTGLKAEQAIFQSVSVFTGTGFTTKEAELITAHKQRRRIASVLMILGKAGFVTLIATLVTTITPNKPAAHIIPYIERILPDFLLRYLNLSIVLFILLIAYRLFHSSRFSKFLMTKIQQKMVDKKLLEKHSPSERPL